MTAGKISNNRRLCILLCVLQFAASFLGAQTQKYPVIDSNYENQNGKGIQYLMIGKPRGIIRQTLPEKIMSIVKYKGGEQDTFYFHNMPEKQIVPVKDNKIQIDSVYARYLTTNFLNTGRFSPSSAIEFSDTREIFNKNTRSKEDRKDYRANLIIHVPVTVYNSIVSLNMVERSFYFDLVNSKTKRSDTFNIKIDSVLFLKKVTLNRNNYQVFQIDKTHFSDTCDLTFNENTSYLPKIWSYFKTNQPSKAKIENTIFDSSCYLGSYKLFDELEDESDFYNPLYNPPGRINDKEDSTRITALLFLNDTWNGSFIVTSRFLVNIRFENCEFLDDAFFRNKILDSCYFSTCFFDKMIDIRGTRFKNGTTFNNYNTFSSGCNILISKNDPIENFQINPDVFNKIFFIIDWGWKNTNHLLYWNPEEKKFNEQAYTSYTKLPDSSELMSDFSEQNLEQVTQKLHQINQYIAKNITDDNLLGSNKQMMSNWINYQITQYDILYCSNNRFFKYHWLLFLRAVVNNGYNGELKFFITCLIWILIFTIIYFSSFGKEIYSHVSGAGKLAPEQKVVNPPKSRQSVFAAFYMSFIIFFSPKFSKDYFGFPRLLLGIVIFEWCLGVFFVILFLVYIAGNYPIISKLLGI